VRAGGAIVALAVFIAARYLTDWIGRCMIPALLISIKPEVRKAPIPASRVSREGESRYLSEKLDKWGSSSLGQSTYRGSVGEGDKPGEEEPILA
jgi:hypothetical protein